MVSTEFQTEMDRKRDSQPKTKIEYITKADVITDISLYFLAGANLEQVKERAPDEIQAGGFDVVLSNHDGTFSEFKSGSLFFDTDYHGDRIRISQGFILPDGTEEFEFQGVGYIDQLTVAPSLSKVTLRCRDLLWRIMDQKIHPRPTEEIAVADDSNIGNGIVTAVETKPFSTVNEDWTVTCTLGGTDGVATFSVVGSVSGSVGVATSGTQFTASNNTVRFSIRAGTTDWIIGDIFTFSSKQYPQWSIVNAGKIMWSILTGFDFDSDTVEPFAALVFDFDSTQSSANTELDYDSFVESIDSIADVGFFDLKGFAPYDQDAIDFIQSILTMLLGSLFTGNDGRIKFKTFVPTFGVAAIEFSDDKKITRLSYNRNIDEVLNDVTVVYRATDAYVFSDETDQIDGIFVEKNTDSIATFKELGSVFRLPWFTTTGQHAKDFAGKLVVRFASPPLNINFRTGLDALTTEIGDRVDVTDTKLSLTNVVGEVSRVTKQFDVSPTAIGIGVRRDADAEQQFGFIGSEDDEGDGISPQNDDFDLASASDKQFAYFSKSGETVPDYRMF